MKSIAFFNVAKIASVVLGFFGALSLVRSLNTPFNWHVGRMLYGGWFDFGLAPSVLWLSVCVVVFTYAIWQTKGVVHPLRRVDFGVFVLFCAVGAVAGYYTLTEVPSQLNLFLLPITTYLAAMLAFGEFLARLRDKSLAKALYLLQFFKMYPIWKAMGFITFLLFASQLYLLVSYFFTPIRIFSLFVIAAMTYFVMHLLNLSKQYEAANVDKIKAEQFKTELITNVSHDIKTPLTSIINYVDLLKNERDDGKASEYVAVLDKKAARLKVLIDDLMEASKAGTGNLRVELQEINFGEILGQAAGEFEDAFAKRNLTLVMRQPDDAVMVQTDNWHMYRILENLFANAAKYALDGTRVFAEIAIKEGKVHFTLQNTSAEPLDFCGGDATEQFLRGDKARNTEGSGLGLYIAKSLTELVHGRLFVHTSGDLFRVDIFL
ncbi:MAG: ATP-binding protein [Defluviitaleaceae bacterium]|nr:ATP-binding protein [Defluviitaleaceae bacterium]